jgi:hypothetical protein
MGIGSLPRLEGKVTARFSHGGLFMKVMECIDTSELRIMGFGILFTHYISVASFCASTCENIFLASGKQLGEEGLRWLVLHCINLTGKMKRDSTEERIAYGESILESIIDSAVRPIDGS